MSIPPNTEAPDDSPTLRHFVEQSWRHLQPNEYVAYHIQKHAISVLALDERHFQVITMNKSNGTINAATTIPREHARVTIELFINAVLNAIDLALMRRPAPSLLE